MDDMSSYTASTSSSTSWNSSSTSLSSSPSYPQQQEIPILSWLQTLQGEELVQVAADFAWAYLEVVSKEGDARTGSKGAFQRLLEEFRISSDGSFLNTSIPKYTNAILRSFIQQAIERFADMIGERQDRSLVLPRYIRGKLLDLFVIPGQSQGWIDEARKQPDGRIPSHLSES
ncbi:hypothetical protein DL96DRAFT_1711668 [Flagelloscypha sp. PMI_526]|nr:hypothetical protein DL96DRAFT_1711668 [Flagelloscypha sp. PMI_526]